MFLYPSSAAKNKKKTLPSVKREPRPRERGKVEQSRLCTGRMTFSQQLVH